MAVQAPQMAAPMALMMNGIPGQYLSTPKTSVLGPKRVACDTCRKRRIRCKHKDLVLQATPENLNGFHNHINGFTDALNGSLTNGANGLGPLSGTNAYLNNSIPMTINGISIFGDAGKRGRTKACFECRKSKRRCVHDENGNVDPVKAAETPVPRGSVASKKHSVDGDGTPAQIKKKPKASSPSNPIPLAPAISQQTNASHSSPQPDFHQSIENGSAYPSHSYHSTPLNSGSPSQHSHASHEHHHTSQTPLDPHLYAYPEPEANDHDQFAANAFPYSQAERPPLYQLPSLEQIANEVLDMNGDYCPTENVHVYKPEDIGAPSSSKQDEAADSAISIPGSEASDVKPVSNEETESTTIQSTIESTATTNDRPTTPVPAASPALQKTAVSDLPLYRPPAPMSASPEQARRSLANGLASSPAKRKRDSMSEAANQMSPKRARIGATLEESQQQSVIDEDAELARVLQAENNGLRRRTSIVSR